MIAAFSEERPAAPDGFVHERVLRSIFWRLVLYCVAP
jgi:hypothetical protein